MFVLAKNSAPVIPTLVPPIHPEEDILFQWRLRRKMEKAREWAQAQQHFSPEDLHSTHLNMVCIFIYLLLSVLLIYCSISGFHNIFINYLYGKNKLCNNHIVISHKILHNQYLVFLLAGN